VGFPSLTKRKSVPQCVAVCCSVWQFGADDLLRRGFRHNERKEEKRKEQMVSVCRFL